MSVYITEINSVYINNEALIDILNQEFSFDYDAREEKY